MRRRRNAFRDMVPLLMSSVPSVLGTVQLSPSKRERIQAILRSFSFRNLSVSDTGSSENAENLLFKRDFLRITSECLDDRLENILLATPNSDTLNEEFYNEYLAKQSIPIYREMLSKRQNLPAYNMKNDILRAIEEHQVLVISGETGCGKTTQVAQFILDDYLERKKGSQCKILCTQPRRISAIAVAQRVANERAEDLGQSVGYQIRMENRQPRNRGSICFCTTGVVLKMMESDLSLFWVSHLIIDEIHERDLMSDFILALIKKIKSQRKDLKIILMSATLNSDDFSRYFNYAPHLKIPGFTFPVEEYYLEDVLDRTKFVYDDKQQRRDVSKFGEYGRFIEPYVSRLEKTKQYSSHVCKQLRKPQCEEINLELILSLLKDICAKEPEGAILVFLTGYNEISALTNMVEGSKDFPPSDYLVFPLHSLMPTSEQKQIFETPPPGCRKIIISTNIAETSITINDVVYVIDCGKIKLINFDVKSKTKILAHHWVSLSNAKQRKGRAGRVKPGICFHLFSRARNDKLEPYQLPEILRNRLEGVILTMKVLHLGQIVPFFNELMDSPNPQAIALAVDLLKRLNALTDDEKLTPLGYYLAKLPMAPHLGKMILFGAIFSCLDPILSIVAALDYKDPFYSPVNKQKEANEKKLELADGLKSDHLLFRNALKKMEECETSTRKFCKTYFLNFQTMKELLDVKKEFMNYLHEMNFVSNPDPKSNECNVNSSNTSLIKAIICAGLYPNVAICRTFFSEQVVNTPDKKLLNIHPKSVLFKCVNLPTNLLVYYQKVYSNRDYIHDASMVQPLPVIFFGDKFKNDGDVISINEGLLFKCSVRTSSLLKELRDKLNWFLEYKISHPGPVIWGKDDETKVLDIIMDLITCEDNKVHEDDTCLDY